MSKALNVMVSQFSPIHVVMLRHTGPYEQMSQVFEQLTAWVEKNGIPALRTIGVYWDNPDYTPAAQLRAAACVEVPAGFQPIATSGLRLSVEDIAGGEYAFMRYTGPYEQLAPVWSEFTNYIEKTLRRKISDNPAFEVYVNDASETPADQLVTELYMPIV